MKKGAIIILLLFLAAGAGGILWRLVPGSAGAPQQEEGGTAEASGIVETSLVSIVSAKNTKTGITGYPVMVDRQETKKVTSSSSRKVAEVLVEEGDRVREGTVLMRYDDATDEIAIQTAEYEIERLKISIETATMNIQKMEAELGKLQGLDLEERQINIASTRNGIAMNEYNIAQREKQIEQLREITKEKEVKSSYVGTVTKITRGSGSDSDSDSESDGKVTITIAESQNLILKGTGKESDMRYLHQGDPVIAYSRVDDAVFWRGSIGKIKKPGEKDSSSGDSDDEMDSYMDSSSGSSYTWYVDLESEENLLVGQHLLIQPDLGQTERTEGIWIDSEYLIEDGSGTFVWAEGSGGRIEKRPVTVSEPDDYGIVRVTEGLDRFDYIAKNTSAVREGMRTRHEEDSTGSGKSSSDGSDVSGGGAYPGSGDTGMDFEEEFDFSDDYLDTLGDFGDYGGDFDDYGGDFDDYGGDFDDYGGDYEDDYGGDYEDDYGDDEYDDY